MIRSQFKLKLSEEQGIFKFLRFVSDTYIQVSFETPVSAISPANDQQLLRQLLLYGNLIVRQAAADAFARRFKNESGSWSFLLKEVAVGLFFINSNCEKK